MRISNILYIPAFMVFLASCDPKRPSRERDPEYLPLQTVESVIPGKDSIFVATASDGNLLEVRLGEIAIQNASSESVISFGQMMIDDHSKAYDELKKMAEMKGMKVLPTLVNKSQAKVDELQKITGNDFDAVYTQLMIADHKEDIDSFTKEAENGSDPDIRLWAKNKISILRHHLDSVQKIHSRKK